MAKYQALTRKPTRPIATPRITVATIVIGAAAIGESPKSSCVVRAPEMYAAAANSPATPRKNSPARPIETFRPIAISANRPIT